MGKKAFLAKILENTFALKLKAKFSTPNLMVFTYHRIYKAPLETKFDDGVFAHSEDIFYQQLIWIKKNFTIISEKDLIETIESGKWFSEKVAVITFDDGYIDNYELAYPILKQLNIPATFFIACDQINGVATPWWDQAAFVVKASAKKEFTYAGKRIIKDRLNSRKAVKRVLRSFKDDGDSDIEKQLNDLSKVCEVSLPSSELVKKQFMSWEQIKEVANNNISIGSHTMSHRILSSLSEDEQRFEIVESKSVLEGIIDKKVNTLSYPVGGELAFNATTKRLVVDAGYKLAYSFIHGENSSLKLLDKFSIKRIELSEDSSLYKGQALMNNVLRKFGNSKK